MKNIFQHPEFISLMQYPEIKEIHNDFQCGFLTENEFIHRVLDVYSEMVYGGVCDLGCGWVNLLN